MSVVIGIDPALTQSGYTVLKDGEWVGINTIDSKKLRGIERLLYVEENVNKLIRDYSPVDLICIEGYAYCRPEQAHQIGELGGIIRRTLHLIGYPWLAIAPPSVKKFGTGKGNTKKEHMMMHVLKKWDVESKNSHEADAYVMAKMGYYILQNKKFYEELTLAQNEALQKPLEEYNNILERSNYNG